MALLPLSFFAGILTIFSPCVFTLLPLLLSASASTREWRRPVSIIASLLVSVGVFTLLLKSSTYLFNVPAELWQIASGGILLLFGLALLFPHLWDKITSYFSVGAASSNVIAAQAQKESFWGDIIIGVALGPVFSSCSPTYAIIVATILPTDFSQGLLHLSLYLLGMGVTLLALAFAGQKLVQRLRWAVDPDGWFKKVLAIAFIVIGLLISSGLEKRFGTWLLELGYLNATSLEVDLLKDDSPIQISADDAEFSIDAPYPAPEISDIEAWINSEGISLEELKGKVVLIDFWTYSCINCIRTIPFVQGWYDKYKDNGFVVIGVHAPEFAFERKLENVQDAVDDYGITYPVALDNDFKTWRAYENRYWPAHYFIDREGNVRHTHFGEGKYEESEAVIRKLLELDGRDEISIDYQVPIARGQTPETYLGYQRAEYFANAREFKPDTVIGYTFQDSLQRNQWTLGGNWILKDEKSTSLNEGNKLAIKFRAKDVYLVMESEIGSSSEVEVRVDGEIQHLGDSVNSEGTLTIDAPILYHLVSSDTGDQLKDSVLELTVGEGVSVFAFTFGS